MMKTKELSLPSFLALLLLFFLPFVWPTRALALARLEVKGPQGREKQIEATRQLAQKITSELESELGLSPPSSLSIHLVGNREKFQSLVKEYTNSRAPDWALAVALHSSNVIIIKAHKLDVLSNNLTSTLRHEIIHIYLRPLVHRANLPSYFNEGLAMWFSDQLIHPQQRKELERAARLGGLIPFSELERNFPPHSLEAGLAYVQSWDFIRFLIKEYGREKLRKALQKMEEGSPFDQAINSVYKKAPSELHEEWKKSWQSWNWLKILLSLFDELTLFGILALLVILGVILKRRKSKKIMKKWEEEEEYYGY